MVTLPKVSNCCVRGVSLKTGTLIIGVLNLVFFVILTIASIWAILLGTVFCHICANPQVIPSNVGINFFCFGFLKVKGKINLIYFGQLTLIWVGGKFTLFDNG